MSRPLAAARRNRRHAAPPIRFLDAFAVLGALQTRSPGPLSTSPCGAVETPSRGTGRGDAAEAPLSRRPIGARRRCGRDAVGTLSCSGPAARAVSRRNHRRDSQRHRGATARLPRRRAPRVLIEPQLTHWAAGSSRIRSDELRPSGRIRADSAPPDRDAADAAETPPGRACRRCVEMLGRNTIRTLSRRPQAPPRVRDAARRSGCFSVGPGLPRGY